MAEHERDGLTRRDALILGASTGVLAASPSHAAARTNMDSIVQTLRHTRGVPGIAVAIVQGRKPILVEGWGVRDLSETDPIDASTIFGIGSNSKAMTAAALAMLVEEGRIKWEDPVTRHLPRFKMADPNVTREITVRDLLLHRSGLGLGAGDLMIWPKTTLSREEVIHGLRHLKPVRGFRTGYDYDNVLYIVAGEVVAAASGFTWEKFLSDRLLSPSGMVDAVPAPSLALRRTNRSRPHARLGPPMRGLGPMRRLKLTNDVDNSAPCGGVWASARDMARWMILQLGEGQIDGKRLWSAASTEEMWRPQTICESSTGPDDMNPGRAMFHTYGLGWNIYDYRGVRAIGHLGLVLGYASQTVIVPSLDLGIAVLTNAEEEGVTNTIINTAIDHHLGVRPFDWQGFYRDKTLRDQAAAIARLEQTVTAVSSVSGRPSRSLTAYVGRYRDDWYGDIVISLDRGRLLLDFTRTPRMRGPLEWQKGDTFRTRFASPEVEDALVTFNFAGLAAPQTLSLAAVSPLADFSYDFQDLAPRRVQ